MTEVLVSQSIEHVQMVIKESVKNSERLVNLKERLIQRNTKEQIQFDQMKNGNGKKKKDQED